MTKPDLKRRVRSFVLELRRRRVIRVSIAYIIVGVGAAEAASIFLPPLGFDGRSVNLVAVLIVLGFPIALVLAWAFDVFPASATGESEAPEMRPVPPVAAVSPEEERAEWRRVRDVFSEAIALAPTERAAYLAGAVGNDPSLDARVRALIESHETEGPLDGLRERVLGALRPVTDLVGQTLLHYRVVERLESGGMGVVYRAEDTRLGRTVALKFLSAHLVTDPEAKARFLIEARAAATMDHPNLCTIHEVGETEDGHLFIAMAFYDGESLKRRIARGSMSPAEALDIAAQMARGLTCAAEQQIVHRDIKPGNVMLTREGTVKIVDFGLAKIGDGQMTRTGTRMGTVSYMSPEQTRGEPVDQRTDVWSVGVVLYELLSGEKPFRGGSDQATVHAILHDDPEPIDELVPGLGLGVASLVEKAMHKDPGQRYADAEGLLRDLERLIADPDRQTSVDVLPALPPEGEHRPVTVVTWVVSGFEDLLDRMEPEEVDQELTRLKSLIRSAVEDYGGVLNEFSEDRAVSLFGVPITHEDDALRATRAALEIRDGWQRRERWQGFALRAAVGTDTVAIRANQRKEERPYRVGGRVVRDTLLLAAACEAGDIVLAPRLSRTLAPFFETQESPAVQLSPQGPTITPLRVLGNSEHESRLEDSSAGSLSRFVGRDNEMASLLRALGTAASDQGQVVSVVGDAGVGKSRLLHELRASIAEEGIRYVQGRCYEHVHRTPFLPMVEAVRGVLGITRTDPEELAELVVQRIQALAPEFDVYSAILLHLLSVESDSYPLSQYVSEDELRSAAAEALCSLFTIGTRGQPLVIFLEDWHWSDAGSRGVLTQLAEMASSYPLLVIVTSRHHGNEHVQLPPSQLRLDLVPLDAEDATKLMRSALHAGRIDDHLAKYVQDKAGGNPFFIEELCHSLTETHNVRVQDGEARIQGGIEGLRIPDTVQAVLRTRLDRLDPEAREVLRCASVIGRDFGVDLLRRVVPSPNRMSGALDVLRGLGLVQRTRLLPDPQYRFKHALTLDVTYESLLDRQRRERHAAVGEAIEEIHEDHLEGYVDRLAHHFSEAERWAKAVHYGFQSATRAGRVWQFKVAEEALGRVRDWIERWDPEPAEHRRSLIRLNMAEVRIYELLGQHDRQRSAIAELLGLVGDEDSPERSAALLREGELAILEARFDEARTSLERAVAVAADCQADDEHRMALRALGLLHLKARDYEAAIVVLSDLVERNRASGTGVDLMSDLLNLANAYRHVRAWEEAWRLVEEAEELEAHASVLDRGFVAHMKGHLLRDSGRLEEAAAAFDQTTRRNHTLQMRKAFPLRICFHQLTVAATNYELGRFDEVCTAYDEAVLAARDAGQPRTLGNTLVLYADALASLGKLEQAIRCYEEATEILRALVPDRTLSRAYAQWARAAAALGEDDPGSLWREARSRALEIDDWSGALEAIEREAELLEDSNQVEVLLQEAATLAERTMEPDAEARVRNRLAHLAWRRSDFEAAASEFERAAVILRSGSHPDRLGVVLNGWGVALTRLDRYEQARGVLLEALETNRAVADGDRLGDSLAALGACSRAAGDGIAANEWYQQCLEARQSTSDLSGEGWALLRLAELAADESGEQQDGLASRALAIAEETSDHELAALSRHLSRAEQAPRPQ